MHFLGPHGAGCRQDTLTWGIQGLEFQGGHSLLADVISVVPTGHRGHRGGPVWCGGLAGSLEEAAAEWVMVRGGLVQVGRLCVQVVIIVDREWAQTPSAT